MLAGSTIFSKIDLKSCYHKIQIRPGKEWKNVFKTREGLYKWLIVPFRLLNAPSTFKHLKKQVLKLLIRKFVVAYIDDILVYSKSQADYLKHLRKVLNILQIKKCSFITKQFIILEFVIRRR